MKGMSLLVPPYVSWSGRDTAPDPPLGTIGLCHVVEAACVAGFLPIVDQREAWMPIVVAAPAQLRGHLASALQELELASPAQFLLVTHETPSSPHTTDILRRVNRRPPVQGTVLAQWLGARLLATPGATVLLHRVLGCCQVQDHSSGRTLRRQVHRTLRCRPSDLTRLAHLATLPRLAPTVDALADSADTTPTRLRERVGRGLGVSLQTYNATPGWKWVLEAAVRRGLGAGGWGLAEANPVTGRPERTLPA